MAGRKPIGEVAMSGAERVRRHRQAERQRKAKAAESDPEATSLPDSLELKPQSNPNQVLIERLTVERDEARRERDHAWRERNDLRRELDVARDGVLIPAPELVETCHHPLRWCAFCRNRWSNDPGVRMIEGGAQQQRLFICSECVQTCVGILAGSSPKPIR
jgi:hypothetical protein